MLKFGRTFLVRVAVGLCGLHTAISYAQEADAHDQGATSLQEIVVTGVRGSIERALQAKKDAIGVIDAISAEDIGKFPDLNVAESLQRIPGVALVRSETGTGTTINVRGLGPDFTRVELNGMSGLTGITGGGPVSAQVTRSFDFQTIAPELFDSATVAKSPNAAMVEGGLAGTVSLDTPKPLSFKDVKLVATVEGNRGDVSKQTDGRYFALASKNWNDTFGVLVGLSYAKLDFQTDDISFGSWGPFSQVADANTLATAPAALRNAATPRTTAYYVYTEQTQDLGGILTTQFRPSDQLLFTLDALYTHGYGYHQDDRPDNPVEGGNSAPTSYMITNGAVTSATFSGIQNRVGTSYRPDSDSLAQVTLKADWQPTDAWRIQPFIGFGNRTSEQELRLYSFAINNSTFTYNVAGDYAAFSSPNTDYSTNPQAYAFNVFYFNKLHNVDKDTEARLDFERKLDWKGISSLDFGVRYARQELDSTTDYAFVLNSSPLVTGLANSTLGAVYMTRPFSVGGAPGTVPGQILAVNPAAVGPHFYPGVTNLYSQSNAGFAFDPFDAILGSGQVTEETIAGYVKANVDLGKLRADFGVRIVRTDETSDGYQGSDFDVTTLKPVSVTNRYTNVLPAANARYAVEDNLFLRATYSRTVTRPDLSYLNPAVTIQSGPRTGSRGNPNLNPYLADQGDLGLEWYFGNQGLIGITGFVKNIESLITLTTTQEQTTYLDQITHQPITGLIAFTQPTNGNSARVTGLETTVQGPFSFLPGILGKTGGILNYTFASSSAGFNSQAGAQSTALPGLSKNSFNAVLYFDNGSIDSRLAYAWRDEYLPTTAGQFGASVFMKPLGTLDYTLNYRPIPAVQLSVQLLNLTDARQDQVTHIPGIRDLPTNVLQLERRAIISARYNY